MITLAEAAAECSGNPWPEVVVTVASLALLAFCIYLIFR